MELFEWVVGILFALILGIIGFAFGFMIMQGIQDCNEVEKFADDCMAQGKVVNEVGGLLVCEDKPRED